jgi:hypothetical protein
LHRGQENKETADMEVVIPNDTLQTTTERKIIGNLLLRAPPDEDLEEGELADPYNDMEGSYRDPHVLTGITTVVDADDDEEREAGQEGEQEMEGGEAEVVDHRRKGRSFHGMRLTKERVTAAAAAAAATDERKSDDDDEDAELTRNSSFDYGEDHEGRDDDDDDEEEEGEGDCRVYWENHMTRNDGNNPNSSNSSSNRRNQIEGHNGSYEMGSASEDYGEGEDGYGDYDDDEGNENNRYDTTYNLYSPSDEDEGEQLTAAMEGGRGREGAGGEVAGRVRRNNFSLTSMSSSEGEDNSYEAGDDDI